MKKYTFKYPILDIIVEIIKCIMFIGLCCFILLLGFGVIINSVFIQPETNLLLAIPLSIIILVMILVISGTIIMIVIKTFQKCPSCKTNAVKIQIHGGTKYGHFVCTKCGEDFWQKHSECKVNTEKK